MDRRELERIKALLISRGIYKTDQQIINLYGKKKEPPSQIPSIPTLQEQALGTAKPPTKITPREDESPVGLLGAAATVTESVFDAAASSLWGALDVSLFGLPGWAFEAVAPETYEAFEEELHDTLAGRLGAGVGTAVGFLLPMGWTSRGVKLAATTVARGGAKLGIKGFGETAKQTTRGLQKLAGEQLAARSGLNAEAATKVIKNVSDDIIGFTPTGATKRGRMWGRIKGTAPAHQLEGRGADMIRNVKESMKITLPDRLAAKLTEANVKFSKKQLLGMTDEIVEILGKAPINGLEGMVAAKFSGRWLPHIMRATTGIAQEGASMGMVMTTMDYIQYEKGVPTLVGEESWGDRFLKNTVFGAVLGGISHFPGGRNATWGWFNKKGDIWKALGRTNSRLNKQVSKMNAKDTKAWAWTNMNTNSTFQPYMNGRAVTRAELLNPKTFKTAAEIGILKKSIYSANNKLLRNFRQGVDGTKGKGIRQELLRDIIRSSPRYTLGAWWMSHESIEEHGLMNVIKDPELAFHLWIGAFMTKRGRSFVHGRKQKFLGLDIGDKPYYYNESVAKQVGQMDRAIGNAENIGKITKQFDGRTYSMMQDKAINPDVDKVLRILEDHGIIYTEESKDIGKLKSDPDINDPLFSPSPDLLNFISPLDGIMKIRGYHVNKNATPKQQIDALKAVRSTPSEMLSTPENTINLTEPDVILNSQEMAVHREWLKVGSDMLDVYRNIMTVVTDGDVQFVKDNGDTWKFRLIPPGENTTRALTQDQEQVVRKIHDLREDLYNADFIYERKRPLQGAEMFEFGRGWSKDAWESKLEQIADIQNKWEVELGGERWGYTTKDPHPHAGEDAWDIWHHIATAKHVVNIRNVYDVLVGNKTDYIGGDAVRWTQIQDGIIKLLRPSESETDGRIIVDSPRRFFEKGPDDKSPLDPDSVTRALELGDYGKLTEFMKALWRINTTTKKAEGFKKDEIINLDDVRNLYEMLTANDVGFPKAEFTDSRMDDYLYKMSDWGIQKRVGGLGANRAQTYILAKGMEVGLFKNAGTEQDQGYGIEAGSEITIQMIKNVYPSISNEGANHYIKAWKNILDGLKGMINTRTDIQIEQLTGDQLNFIYGNEILLKPEFIESAQERMNGKLIAMTEAVNEQITGLRSELDNLVPRVATVGVEGVDPMNLIKARIKDKQNTLKYISDFSQVYLGSITGKGLHRAAAFINYVNRSGLFDVLSSLPEVTTPGEFKSVTDQIKNIQRLIADDFSTTLVESADMFTLHRDESVIRERAEEIEGRSHMENKIRVTPDTFFQEYGLTTESFTNGRYVPAVSYENNSKIFQKLYDNTVKNREAFPEHRDGMVAFRDELYRVAGFQYPSDVRQMPGVVWRKNEYFQYETPLGIGEVRISDYPTEAAAHATAEKRSRMRWTETTLKEPDSRIKNQAVRLFNMFERQVHIKSITVAGDGGHWESRNMSKGPLTDLYNEVFGERGFDLVLFDREYIDREGKIQYFDGVEKGTFSHVVETLANPEFRAAQMAGGSKIKRIMGQALHEMVEGSMDINRMPYEKEELTRMLEGSHYMVPADENIMMLISRDQFSPLAERFVEWWTEYGNSDYVNSYRNNDPDGRAMSHIRNLDAILAQLEQSRLTEGEQINRPGEVFAAESIEGASGTRNADALSSTIYKMWDSMYSQRTNGDWLNYMFEAPDKWLKYERQAQNLGYSRDSALRREFLLEIWGDEYGYIGDIVRRYAGPEKDILESFIIDDSNISVKGEVVNGLITDNRSAAEWNLNQQFKEGRIGEIQLRTMQNFYRESDFINAEQSNAATVVRRERLDYLLTLDGQSELIGESAGQKPVGFSSYTDANGTIHVFMNKTHYFYNSQFDKFFERNLNIDELSLKSGSKYAGRVRTGAGLRNNDEFRAFSEIPTIEALENIYGAQENYFRDPIPRNYFANWVNSINTAEHPEAIALLDANQMVTGTTYGTPHEAKVSKQFGNWGDKNINAQLYDAYRSDAADRFADKAMPLYDVTNTHLLSDEMRSIIQNRDDVSRAIDTQTDNASTAAIWIEAGGAPLDPISKSFTDNQMKKKYIIDAGILDGFTTSGGSTTMRNNADLRLEVPTYVSKGDGTNRQVTLGEGNVGQTYLHNPILFDGDYAVNRTKVPGVVPREKLKTATTQTLSFRQEVEVKGEKYVNDYLINMKTLEVFDPMSKKGDPYLELKDAPFSDNVKNRIREMRKIMGIDITSWGHLFSEVRNVLNEGLPKGEGFNLVSSWLRNPKAGSHDLIVQRIRDSIVSRDGGLSELNPHDATTRSQGDYDTDHGNFHMDMPFDVLVHAYRHNGEVMEPEMLKLSQKDKFDYDPTDWRSSMMQYGRIKNYSKKRGHLIKTPRKLTFGQLLFNEIDGLTIGNHDIVFNDTPQGKRNTATDNQSVLDLYDGFAKNIKKLPEWFNETYFTGEYPFFKLRVKDKNGNLSYKRISLENNPAEVNIVYKILSDFGKLLTLEGNIWEAGEPMTPRYTDFVSRKRAFGKEYSTRDNRVNFNFYNYLVARGLKSEANKLFYKNDSRRMKSKDIEDIMGPIGRVVRKNLTMFEKSLEAITSRDWLEAQERKYPDTTDYFSSSIDKLIAKYRAEFLKHFEVGGERPDRVEPWDGDSIIRQEWDAINEFKSAEMSLAQTTILEEQVRRLERVLSDDKRKKGMDEQDLKYYTDNLTLKKELLATILGKISLGPDFNKSYGNQKFITQKKIPRDKENRHIYRAKGGEVVRNSSGKFVKSLKKGDEYNVRSKEVVVINPLEIVPVTTNEMISGLAHAKTVLGINSQIIGGQEATEFGRIQDRTRGSIKSLTYNFLRKKGFRDWTEHEVQVQAIIDDGLKQIAKLAGGELPARGQFQETFLGSVARERAEYGKIFLLGLLAHGDSGNRVHYMKFSGNIVEPVRAPSSTVIRAVFDAIKAYGIVPNYRDFVTNYAKDHRAWFDVLVQNEGYDRAFRELSNSELGYSLTASNIQSASNTPFLPKEQYQNITRYMEMKDAIDSQFADLFTQIIQDRVTVDPITAKLLKDKFISEMEAQETGSGWRKFRNLFQISRGHLFFDGVNMNQFGVGKGEGLFLGEIVGPDPSITNNIITGQKRVGNKRSLWKFIDDVAGESNQVESKQDGQTKNGC